MKKFIEEFKAFAIKGNVIDLAVAVVIGGAFTAIVKSLVDDLIMPLIAALFGTRDFSALIIPLNGSEIKIGSFLQAVVNFLLIALVIFTAIKMVTKVFRRKPAPAPVVVAPAPTKEELLLTEIRDLLKKK
ncbi:MAG: large conductance mechanosensitive channel protein MscL [Clostridiaceae bacterium]